MSPILTLILALTITLAIEIPLGVMILKRKDSVIPLVLINILTNPALNAALMLIFVLTRSYPLYWTAAIIGEVAVFAGEGFLIKALCDIPLKRSLLFSTIVNAASLFLGSALLAAF